jgi:putative colanic acid biosynthesis glycosyltransferase
MRVLHINVRLQEGGAARVALSLHLGLLDHGFESAITYGWGAKGGRSLDESHIPGATRIGSRLQVAGNMALHPIVGSDVVLAPASRRRHLRDLIREADVVHLHVVHSYFLPFRWLVDLLVAERKPVVWTAHDFWPITGRCAFTEGCSGWTLGCGRCPTLTNYPPVLLDRSRKNFVVRREAISKLGDRLHFVAPSEFVSAVLREALPDMSVTTICNWIDEDLEAAVRQLALSDAPLRIDRPLIRVAVSANDLSDVTKVDRELVESLLRTPGVEVHTVGSNSPFQGAGVVNHGNISSRERYATVLHSTDVSIFTSEKDTFGLVMIESIACGVPVIALESPASREVLGRLGFEPVSRGQVAALFTQRQLPQGYAGSTAPSLRASALADFGRRDQVQRYVDLYQDLRSQWVQDRR